MIESLLHRSGISGGQGIYSQPEKNQHDPKSRRYGTERL